MALHRQTMVAWALAGMAAVPASAIGHDFWLQPDKFFVAEGKSAAVSILVGHGSEKQRSPLPARRIVRFAHYLPNGQIKDLQGANAGVLSLQGAGTHLIVITTDNRAQSHVPGAWFTAHLQAEGLSEAIALRAATGTTHADGAERYSRVAKTLVEAIGQDEGGAALATAALGLPLEIVLDCNPSFVTQGAQLPLHVSYHGVPLAGGTVRLTDLDHDAEAVETKLTDKAGQASFTMPGPGKWRFSVTWTKPVQLGDGIDFDTVFSSLSFGVPLAPHLPIHAQLTPPRP